MAQQQANCLHPKRESNPNVKVLGMGIFGKSLLMKLNTNLVKAKRIYSSIFGGSEKESFEKELEG